MEEYEQTSIWYKISAADERIYAINVKTTHQWYESHLVLMTAQFSFDEGQTWETIAELRRRNGITFPFLPKIDGAPDGSRLVDRMLEKERAEVAELERQAEALKADVEEQENMLEQILEMERKLDELKLPKRDKYTQIEGRMFQIANRLQKGNQDAEKKTADRDGRDRRGKARVEPKKAAIQQTTNEVKTPMKEVVANKIDVGKERGMAEEAKETKNAVNSVAIEAKKEVKVDERANSGIEEKMESVKITTVASPPSSAPPRLFPMLQTTTMPNDYTANESIIALLRTAVAKGIAKKSIEATAEMFSQPPTCTLCPDSRPLTDLPSFIEHVLNRVHIQNVTSSGGKISVGQVFYWKTIVESGTTTRMPI